jgi:hypothetical protein
MTLFNAQKHPDAESVVDAAVYDKNKLQRKDGYVYYKYQGITLPISASRDLRKNMIFGIKELGLMSFVHIPQYKKLIKVKASTINAAIKKSIKYSQMHYEEV